MNKHCKVDFLRLSVEEKLKRRIGNYEYSQAYEKSQRHYCTSMDDRIKAILRYL
jgi:hypothetical protein